ncbi:NAD(P)-binding protein [Coniochaeta ligniaria NRRL 30616]|uniref:NAD(P)-binding protein n=1 Tax=Coniochaeta ligniaria NRRL 30616 TaxID=1408157 RepID=A0A1J7I625_9PEZI|nr:NAD(P)-binding protein [Coniochaeta ligniaria NRRL 30616]
MASRSDTDSNRKKLVVVVGATGNQGGSVARRFLRDPRYAVRALTRDTSSPAAQELAALGAEVVRADLDDVKSLETAFAGANVIFSVTNYWEPFFRPDCRAKAQELGITCRRYAYDVEYRQGKNIADAAATVADSLDDNGFLVSTLSHATKCSNGKFKDLYHFDSKADVFPDYVAATHPKLAAKMSCIETGFFTTSYRILPDSYFKKVSHSLPCTHNPLDITERRRPAENVPGQLPDGTFEMRFPCSPEKLVPHLDVNANTGNFVYAVHQMPPGKAYMAGEYLTWPDYAQTWARVTGQSIAYREISFDEMVAATPDHDCGVEVALMFSYSSDPGYDGGRDLLTAEDLRKAGIDCPMRTVEESLAQQDWSATLSQ